MYVFREAAPFFALLCLVPAALAAAREFQERQLLERQTGIHSIRALGWQQFETLLAEVYRRQGYAVERRGGSQPDGGIDLVLRREGTILVQCKHWKAWRVRVNEVRELLGVVTAERARSGILGSSPKSADTVSL